MSRRIYISGPMSGYEDLNIPAFNRAAAFLRAQGWDAVNPGEFIQNTEAVDQPSTLTRAEYLRKDIHELSTCDAIYLLKGWRRSVGANIELQVATFLNLEVHSELMWPLEDDILPKQELIDQHVMEVRLSRYGANTSGVLDDE